MNLPIDPGSGNVLGIGTDIIEVDRIDSMIRRHDATFLERVYTRREVEYCGGRRAAAQHFAGRWAAKEAALKALGTGWARGIRWTDMEITNDPDGRPHLVLHGAARQVAEQAAIREMKVSISHCKSFAVACVVALG